MVHFLKQHPWKNYVIVALVAALVSTWLPVQASFAPSVVKTIQCGDIAVNNTFSTGTSTLSTAVVVAKSVPIFLGSSSADPGAGGNPDNQYTIRIELVDTTTVRGERLGTSGDGTANYCVVEFF